MATVSLRGHKLLITACLTATFLAALGLAAVWAAEAPATGENLINITVKDAPVAKVLEMIARAGGVNVVVGEEITGKIQSITLTDVTVEQALQYICLAENIYWRKLGNAYIVSKTPPPAPAVQPVLPTVEPVLPINPPTPQPLQGSGVSNAGGISAPPLAPGNTVVVSSSTGGPPITVQTLPVKYQSAEKIALMFGGSVITNRATGGGFTQRGSYGASRTRGGQAASASGFSDMQAPGAPGGNYMYGQFGGGFGGNAGGGGQQGGGQRQGGGQGGQFGGGQGGAGGASQLLPQEVMPPIAFMPLNVLLVRGTQEGIDQFREMLALLDQPIKQVRISTKFVTVETTAARAFGIDFFVDNGEFGFFNQGQTFGGGQTIVRFIRGRFNATLQALLQDHRAQVINEPSVTTENNMEATVDFTTEIPYITATQTYNEFGFATTTYNIEQVSVDNSLEVTPRINADDSVTMYLTPTISDTPGVVTAPDGTTYPIVTTQSVTTQVTVDDGETLAIGGMVRKNESVNIHKTPLLSQIPIIGNLFSAAAKNISNNELIILVTPQIIRPKPRD
jgi:general secretion pathway protein D